MITALHNAILYVTAFSAILTMFASIISIVWWLCFTVFRALSPP